MLAFFLLGNRPSYRFTVLPFYGIYFRNHVHCLNNLAPGDGQWAQL